jgi:hypothetical protein
MADNVSVTSTAAERTSKRSLDKPPVDSSHESENTNGTVASPSPPQHSVSDVEKGTPPPTAVAEEDPFLVRLIPTDAAHPYVRPFDVLRFSACLKKC